MSRDELLRLLLIERYSPKAKPTVTRESSVADIRHAYKDDDLTTYARRKALDDACTGFDIPRSSVFRSSTHVDGIAAGQTNSARRLSTDTA